MGTVDDLSDTGLRIGAVLFLDRLVVFHLAFKVAEVLPDLLVLEHHLLIVGLCDLLGQQGRRSIAFVQTGLNRLYQVDLLLLHVTDSVR